MLTLSEALRAGKIKEFVKQEGDLHRGRVASPYPGQDGRRSAEIFWRHCARQKRSTRAQRLALENYPDEAEKDQLQMVWHGPCPAQRRQPLDRQIGLKPFSDMAGELFARNWNAGDIVTVLDNPGRPAPREMRS